MTVEFDATVDDLVDATMRVSADSRTVRGWRLEGRVVYGILIGAVAAALSPAPAAFRLVAALVGFVVGAVIYTGQRDATTRKRLRKLYLERLGAELPFRVEVSLLPHGVRVRGMGNESTYAWRNVESVTKQPDSVDIRLRQGLIVVRKRAFHTYDVLDEFVEMARRLAEQARTVSETPLPRAQTADDGLSEISI
ncbi:MAG: hypothetical protein HYU66_00390 [Armatimonadetes bacterium]|nr:hypothetical protein [Armatimonadota bacterium]